MTDGWMPIETAPRDGSEFEAWYNGEVYVTRWYVHPSVQGWITDEFDCGDYEFEPTLWRPSPPMTDDGEK